MSADPSTNPEAHDNVIEDTDVAFGHVVPVPNQNKKPVKNRLGFEYMEHCFIGDSTKLTLADGQQVAASAHKFALPNGLNLTYGQINGLAGDFYGTKNPISDGTDDQDRSVRFVAAYNSLAVDTTRQPKEATDILAVLQAGLNAVNNALANHQDPSIAYSKLPDVSIKLEYITFGRKDIPGYLGLARINWDHFGIDARTAYNAGHATAILKAVNGDLEGAYAMNAFADHFLEDSFSAGHLRTPRRLLHTPHNLASDVCAKFMHDEDGAIGLNRALDQEAAENSRRCVRAVQASVDEVYKAFTSRTAPSPADYAAWKVAPTLDSARATTQALATLFTFKKERRKTLSARRVWDFKTNWRSFWTAAECKLSGLWNSPIVIDSVKHTPSRWTDICIAGPRIWSLDVFYQSPSGSLLRSQNVDGLWTRGFNEPITDAVRFTPLASVDWDSGEQASEFTLIRVYYLDRDYVLQEYCYSEGSGWYARSIGSMNIIAAHSTRLAAVYYGPGCHIRIYLQEAGSLNITEVCHDDGRWFRGEVLRSALEGTSIAAVTYLWDSNREIRVYFQKGDLSLSEYSHNRLGWNQVPGGSPIDAVVWVPSTENAVIQVYWRDINDSIVMSKRHTVWEPVATVLQGGVTSGFQFSVLQWDQGKILRIYWQGPDHVLREHCNDNSGQSWFPGSLKLGAIE
ncbi:fungal fucose-specific lectin-domain-containing protein [Hygrophoropsis aurantiaca]|uniref:Fungal fucose-specific lectin-domain-containing protein n=1 Tax=Hygrophoropsis aurantiaca TaxID=72124 RepID=A0ACB7ZVZ7_9AGAM|nr:fungal fucose-specific lectin-domain-containing protein [Hygrophoropsis aurantiaca]